MKTCPQCDKCGRFFRSQEPGSSWVMVPGIEVPGHTSGDERDRCAKCTERHGPAVCGPAYRADLCCGVHGEVPQTSPDCKHQALTDGLQPRTLLVRTTPRARKAMEISRHTINENTNITYSTISLAAHEIDAAVGSVPDIRTALAAATRAGQFSPVTASATDIVGVDLNPDGSAAIVVAAKTVSITLGDTAGASS